MPKRLILSLVFALAAGLACARAVREAPTTTSNAALVQRYIAAVWNEGDTALVNQLIAPDFVDHDPNNPPNLPPGARGLKQHVAAMRRAFPDVRFTIDELIAAGDKVVTRWTVRGTHQGPLMGIAPTNKEVVVTGIWIDRIVAGRIVEEWAQWDAPGLLRQLGAVARQ